MSEYIKIVFQNLEPVRIADDSTSQSGQTITLRYIPGSAIRGVVINALAGDSDFETVKKSLFSEKVRYLNGYLTDGDRELLPSPRGFYEDKTEGQGKKELDNVVTDGRFQDGMKRASLGRFCRIEGDCIYYYNIDADSDLRIKINDEKQNVFRHESICAGYVFTAYVAVEDRALGERIRQVFAGDFVIGNGRFSGLGKCRVISCEYASGLPFEAYLPAADLEGECYMMLLSNTVMRGDQGELCGLNERKLAEKMGVSDLRIDFCATSTVEVKGYNSKWKTKIPSAVMYEQGSVFHLKYKGRFTRERMLALCDRGIGIRLNEGFGRVVFPDGYESVRYKQEAQAERNRDFQDEVRYEEDRETLKTAAGCYYRNLLERQKNAYIVEYPLPKGELANSQLGILDSFATAYKYEPVKAREAIKQYLEHALDKEKNNSVQKEKNSIAELKQYVYQVFDADVETLLSVSTAKKDTVMEIPKKELITEDDALKLKLELITGMIRYDNKKEEA